MLSRRHVPKGTLSRSSGPTQVRGSRGRTSLIGRFMNGERRRAPSETSARSLPLAPGLLAFAPICLLGNEFGTLFRYADVNSAILFPPYAALTAALVASSRRHWIWYILVGSLTHFVAH